MVWKPHATVAAIVEKQGQFLVVEEKSDGKIVYNQPAGHLDPDESLVDAVIRETNEETAWQFEPEYVTGIYQWKHPQNEDQTFLRIAFYGECHNHYAEQQLDEGIIRATWMTREELVEKETQLRSPMVLRCIDDYLAGHQYPLDILINL
jgi:8-oxo-dGTP pyrophosphatase MutT (NUDIX family)